MKTTTELNKTSTPEKEIIRNNTVKQFDAEIKSENFGWLTEHSRQFLASGYLSEGETPEARIKDIAENAEKILKMPGFAA